MLLVCATASVCLAQSAQIHGRVFTDEKLPAEASTVILLAADSSILTSTACDKEGFYKFEVDPGNYLILASGVGFSQSISPIYTVSDNQDVTVKDIYLIKSIPVLKEVAINAKRSYVETKPGRVVLNVQGSTIAEGNSVYDILRQAPGVHVGGQGNVSIIGRQNALIMLDGKPVNLTGDNLSAYLQGMLSSSVQQIELLTNPSARFEAGGAGVINIISKKGTNVGTNATFTVGGGYGKFYKANAGISFNNRTAGFNFFGGYNFSANKTFSTFTTDRYINYAGLESNYNLTYYNTRESFNHTFRLGTDLFLSPAHTLGILVSGTVNNNNNSKDNSLRILNRGVLDSTISTVSVLKRNLANFNYDVNYTAKLDDEGQALKTDVSFNHFNRSSNEYISNHFNNAAGVSYRPDIYQQNISPSNINIWAAKADYVKPFSKTSQLEAGLKYSWVKSNNQLIFGPKINGQYTADPKFSSDFVYTENVNSAYGNYIAAIGKLNVNAGLRLEQTNATGDTAANKPLFKKNYLDLFPQVQLKYVYNNKNTFTLNFNRSIQRPAYEEINPFLYYVDLYDYRSGNPQLLPEYTNKIELAHTHNNTIVTSIYASYTKDIYDFNVLEQNDATKVNVTSHKNFGKIAIYGVRFFTPVRFAAWWNATFSADVSYQRIKAYPQNGDLNKGTQDVLLQTMQSVTLGGGFAIDAQGKYESPTFYGFSQFKANYRIDAGISKQVLNKMGVFRLAVTDMFRTERDRAYTNYRNLNLSIVNREEGRVVRFGFSYRFGNTSLKGSARHNAGNEEEQKRAGGVAGN